MTTSEKLGAIRAVIARTLADPTNRFSGTPFVEADEVAHRAGLPLRSVVAILRHHARALGGEYRPARFRRGNPREFNTALRHSVWLSARLYIHNHGAEK
jgi:hypothetical protein